MIFFISYFQIHQHKLRGNQSIIKKTKIEKKSMTATGDVHTRSSQNLKFHSFRYLIFKKLVLFRPNRAQQTKLNLESQIYFS